MKIACIATSQVPSSTANSIQVMKVCQALAQENGLVCLWVPGVSSYDWQFLSAAYGVQEPFGVRWLTENRFWRRYDFSLKSVLNARKWGAELIYTWAPQAAVLALWLGMPVVLELHDLPTGKIGPWLFKQFIHHSGKKRLLLITEALRKSLEDQYLIRLDGPEVQIAPNGTEIERYSDLPDALSARFQLGLPDNAMAVYTGHLYAGRGMGLLVGLAERFPEVNFLWVGGRPEDVELWRTRLVEREITNVVLTGFIENSKLPLYQAAGDVLLMPYEQQIEGSSGGNSAAICSPMKMFDYLASGRAIITSDLSVLHEVLNPANAVFCPPDDVEQWGQALSRLLSDSETRKDLADQAKRDARRYTWRARARKGISDWL